MFICISTGPGEEKALLHHRFKTFPNILTFRLSCGKFLHFTVLLNVCQPNTFLKLLQFLIIVATLWVAGTTTKISFSNNIKAIIVTYSRTYIVLFFRPLFYIVLLHLIASIEFLWQAFSEHSLIDLTNKGSMSLATNSSVFVYSTSARQRY